MKRTITIKLTGNMRLNMLCAVGIPNALFCGMVRKTDYDLSFFPVKQFDITMEKLLLF